MKRLVTTTVTLAAALALASPAQAVLTDYLEFGIVTNFADDDPYDIEVGDRTIRATADPSFFVGSPTVGPTLTFVGAADRGFRSHRFGSAAA